MKKILFFSITFLSMLASQAQNRLRYEARLEMDNDVFTGDRTSDRYYSSGTYLFFRVLKDSIPRAKIIRSYKLNHRIYTPRSIRYKRWQNFDRPYAGTLSLSIANEYYFTKSNSYLKIGIELGWLGPKSFVGETQRAWHGWFGMPEPQGWQYQIKDSPLINLNVHYIKALFTTNNLELSSENKICVGTVFNNLSSELNLRIGKIKPLNQSAYTNASLGLERGSHQAQKTIESYFFYAPGLEYVIYNATLQGNIIGQKSIHTVDATKWIWQHRLGVMFSWEVFDFGMIAYWRKKGNPEAYNHNYVGIRLTQRF